MERICRHPLKKLHINAVLDEPTASNSPKGQIKSFDMVVCSVNSDYRVKVRFPGAIGVTTSRVTWRGCGEVRKCGSAEVLRCVGEELGSLRLPE